MRKGNLEKVLSFRVDAASYSKVLKMAQEREYDMSDFMRLVVRDLVKECSL